MATESTAIYETASPTLLSKQPAMAKKMPRATAKAIFRTFTGFSLQGTADVIGTKRTEL